MTVAADLLDATGISQFLMTDEQEGSLTDELLSGTQELLNNVTDLLGLNGTGIFPTGFAGAVANPATGTLNLWWESGVPQVIVDLIGTLVPAIGLSLHSADHSRTDLIAAIEAHRDEMTGVDIAFPKEDGSGIVLVHAPDTPVDAQAIAQLTGIPVTVTEMEPAEEVIGGRQADVSNANGGHYGGAMITRAGHLCSTGFPVLWQGQGLLLSAAHCDPTGNAAWNNGAGAQLTPGGTAASVNLATDSLILNPNGGTSAFVYSGGPSSTTKRAVGGSAATTTGDSVASSGANSGEHRGKVVTNAAYRAGCGSYTCTFAIAGSSSGIAIAQGDSGGPVYAVNSAGKAIAKGIIWGGNTRVAQSSCNAVMKYDGTAADPNKCYRYVWYVPIRSVLASWSGVTLQTR